MQWDARNWSRAVDFWAGTVGTGAFLGADVLELGSRDGGLTLWLVEQGARKVTCSDLLGPSQYAKDLHKRSGACSQIEYANIDATNIGIRDQFDIVAFKSVMGGIRGAGGFDAQGAAIESIYSALRPGGALVFAENLLASPLHTWLRKTLVPWGTEWNYPSLQEVRDLLGGFSHSSIQTFGFAGTFGRTERQRNALAVLDEVLLDRLIPQHWNYIVSGVAWK